MPQLLVEVCRKGTPVLLESKETRPGCLGKFKLICCDYSDDTENGRFYSEKLWENCSCEGSKMSTRIKEKRAFGELDHPTERLDSHLTCSAVNLVKFEKDPETKTYVGTFDILDTPYGKMVKTYLDYGSRIGVSSRGAGDIVVKEGRQCVNEDTYDWEAFDVVLDPAVSKSKATVVESKQVELIKSLQDIVNESTDPYELRLMLKLIENTQAPERDSLIESINNKLSSYNSEGGATLSQLTEDLEKSLGEVAKLEEKVSELQKELSARATRVSVLESAVNSLKSANLKLRSVTSRASVSSQKEIDELNKKLDRASSALEVRNSQINEMKSENCKMSNTIEELNKSVTDLSERLEESHNELQSSKTTITESANHQSQLSKQLDKMTESAKLYDNKIATMNSTITTLKESNASLLSNYIRKVAQLYSLNEKELAYKVKLSKNITVESVESVAESMRKEEDRLRALPFNITKGDRVDEEVYEESINPDQGLRISKMAKALSRKSN